MTIFAMLAASVWAGMLLFWGRFWRADERLPAASVGARDFWPEVAVVIPARDEANTISTAIRAHLTSSYAGRLQVILVDDGSSDGTGALARSAAQRLGAADRLTVVRAPPLEPGWTGKLWAVRAGLAQMAEIAPDARYVLLTDADIAHAPETLTALVDWAERRDLSLTSLMARLDARGRWGRLLIPAFVFFFQKLYPFPLSNRPGASVAAGAGGCMLARADALREIGGVSAIRGALIDDCALAAALKHGPPPRATWIGLADREVVSLRDNRSLASVWNMVARTAYTQLGRSPWALAGAVLGMAFLYLTPPLALLLGLVSLEFDSAVIGGLGVAL
ncbi:MAG: glycosyltransferase, partial [Pseudomonadota bacterium]